jgi:hypothetical protein
LQGGFGLLPVNKSSDFLLLQLLQLLLQYDHLALVGVVELDQLAAEGCVVGGGPVTLF